MKPRRKLPPGTDIVAFLKSLDLETRRTAIALLGETDREALDRAWPEWAHAGQLPPAAGEDGAAWSTWVIKAGRGFGKTLAGAQWITARVAEAVGTADPRIRIALVGATVDDARRVMVEGRSGLIEVAGTWIDTWSPSTRRLTFVTGAQAELFSGASPDMLRGPEHHYAWCDELAKWEKARESWDMLQLGLRVGAHPRAIVTTTPQRGPVLRAIMDAPGTVTTGGPTARNPHLPASWKARVEALYAGTRRGRQELDGELLADAQGALWTVELIERCRFQNPPPEGVSGRSCSQHDLGLPGAIQPETGDHPQDGGGGLSASTEAGACGNSLSTASRSPSPSGRGPWVRTLIAVDPPSGGGTCGIIACARDADGIAHVLADHSVTGRSPEGWARAVAAAAAAHATREVIAESNQGGKMVKAVLLTADPALTVRLVTATHGKTTRAEPVAHLFEAGKAVIHGRMPELEAELLGMIDGGGYEGPGNSPDRADAMVWGVGEVVKGREARIWVG